MDRIGEERVMNCGMKAKIIAYRSAKDIDVEFEDGSIRTNIQYCNFKKGEVINIKFENLKDIRLNEENINSQNIKMKIIEYNSSQDIKVEFEDGYIKKCLYHDFKKGKVKNPYYKYLYNRGYLGEAKTTDGKGNPLRAYQIWQHIFERCYSDEFHKNYPTYKGCEVCEEWYCYTNFKKWYDEHYYELENERVELDKDILIKGNRIYSPESCIFVPKKINIIFSRNNPKENGLPRGVSWDKENKKYLVQFKGKKLGRFLSIKEAELVYNNTLLKYIKEIAEEYKDKIPNKLYNRLIEISNEEEQNGI